METMERNPHCSREELVERALEYAEPVLHNADDIYVEKRAAWSIEGEILTEGTIDLLGVSGYFHIRDWKSGYRELNQDAIFLQGGGYYGIACQLFGPRHAVVDFINLRHGTVFTKDFAPCDLPKIAAVIRSIKAKGSDDGPLVLNPVPDFCRHCRARGTCSAVALNLAVASPERRELTISQVKRLLDLEALAKPAFENARELAKDVIARGGEVPGYYTQPRNGRRSVKSGKIHELNTALRPIGGRAQGLLECGTFSHKKVRDYVVRLIAAEKKLTLKAAGEKADKLLQPFVKKSDDTVALMRED